MKKEFYILYKTLLVIILLLVLVIVITILRLT